jgi:hypothetical protein
MLSSSVVTGLIREKICETIEATIKDIVDDKIKTHVDAHVNPLIEPSILDSSSLILLYKASTSVECSFKANVWSLAVVWRVVIIAACFKSVCACSVIVVCCFLTVSINGFTWASTCVLFYITTYINVKYQYKD